MRFLDCCLVSQSSTRSSQHIPKITGNLRNERFSTKSADGQIRNLKRRPMLEHDPAKIERGKRYIQKVDSLDQIHWYFRDHPEIEARYQTRNMRSHEELIWLTYYAEMIALDYG